MKGKKNCSKCGTIVGCRTQKCKCGHEFYALRVRKKPKSKKGKKNRSGKTYNYIDLIDHLTGWHKLQKGDKIKVTNGPYHVSKEGIMTYLGCTGEFTVYEIYENGILGSGKKGLEFIYMGEEGEGFIPFLIRQPHTIKKLEVTNPAISV